MRVNDWSGLYLFHFVQDNIFFYVRTIPNHLGHVGHLTQSVPSFFCEIFTLWPSSTLNSRRFLLSTSQHAFPKATTCHGLEMKYLLKGPIIELKNWYQRTVLFGDVRIWGLAGKINHRRLVLASLSCPRFFCLSLCFPSVMSKVVSAAMILCPESVALRGMD